MNHHRSFWVGAVNALERKFPWLHVAGSYRRNKTEITDLDFVATMPYIFTYQTLINAGVEIIGNGECRMRIRLTHKGQTIEGDVKICEPRDFGTCMLHSTGSKQFNIVCRTLAKRKGLKLNEYGIEDLKTGEVHHFADEREALAFIGRSWHEPEDR